MEIASQQQETQSSELNASIQSNPVKAKQGTNETAGYQVQIDLHNGALLRQTTWSLVTLVCITRSLSALAVFGWRRLGFRSLSRLFLRRCCGRRRLRLRLGLLATM